MPSDPREIVARSKQAPVLTHPLAAAFFFLENKNSRVADKKKLNRHWQCGSVAYALQLHACAEQLLKQKIYDFFLTLTAFFMFFCFLFFSNGRDLCHQVMLVTLRVSRKIALTDLEITTMRTSSDLTNPYTVHELCTAAHLTLEQMIID